MEKRSYLRSWGRNGGKIPRKSAIMGIAVIAIVSLSLILAYSTSWAGDKSQHTNQTLVPVNKTPAPKATPLPLPSIKINSPVNTTYNTSTPKLSIIVTGSRLNQVSLKIDNRSSVSISNNGSLASLNSKVDPPLSDGAHKLLVFANNTAGKSSSLTVYFTVKTSAPKPQNIVGKLGVPLVNNGLEITVNSTAPAVLFTTVKLFVRNLEKTEKAFKIGPGTIILDNTGQQYEIVKISGATPIAQTDLYPLASREGSLFFEPLKDGRKVSKLVLYVNDNKLEFILYSSK